MYDNFINKMIKGTAFIFTIILRFINKKTFKYSLPLTVEIKNTIKDLNIENKT